MSNRKRTTSISQSRRFTTVLSIMLCIALTLNTGCNKSSKKVNTTVGQQNIEKKTFDPIGNSQALCRGTVFLAWDIITLGYDKKEQSGRKEDFLTYQQENNVEFMKFIGCIFNCN